jgi:nucleotide-binding universal stress UspA family protein
MKKSKPIQIIILLTVILGASLWYLSLVYQSHLVAMERELLLDKLAAHATAFSRALEKKITFLHALQAFAETADNEKELDREFSRYAERLFQDAPALHALIIAPAGINKYV